MLDVLSICDRSCGGGFTVLMSEGASIVPFVAPKQKLPIWFLFRLVSAVSTVLSQLVIVGKIQAIDVLEITL